MVMIDNNLGLETVDLETLDLETLGLESLDSENLDLENFDLGMPDSAKMDCSVVVESFDSGRIAALTMLLQ